MAGPENASRIPTGEPPARDRKVELAGAAEAIERLQKAAETVAADAASLKPKPNDSARPIAPKPAATRPIMQKEAIAAGLGIAAVICAALLGAYAGGDHEQSTTIAEIEKFAPWKPLTAAQYERDVRAQAQSLAQEVKGLRAQLRNQADAIHAAETRLNALQAQMAGLQGLAGGAAQISSRVDKVERDAGQRMDKQAAQIERLERLMSDPVATSAIQKLHTNPSQEGKAEGPKPIDRAMAPGEYRLRGVRDGIATIQTSRGMIEVAEGDTIPGLGRVRGIERVNGRWMVLLRNGAIDSD